MRGLSIFLLLCLVLPARGDSLLPTDSGDLFAPVQLIEGDLVTIVISDSVRTRQAVQVQNQSSAGVTGPLVDILGAFIGFRPSHSDEDGRNEIADSTSSYQDTVTARVVKVEGQVLNLEAHRVMKLDGKERKLSFFGKVRRQDVTTENRVGWELVADAQLSVDGLHKSPVGPGFLTRALRFLF